MEQDVHISLRCHMYPFHIQVDKSHDIPAFVREYRILPKLKAGDFSTAQELVQMLGSFSYADDCDSMGQFSVENSHVRA